MTRRWPDSFRNAAQGVRWAARTQRNVRLHLCFTVAALAAALALRLSPVEMVLVAFAVGLVLVAELLNSAVEALVDLVTEREHPLARAAKDTAAGAVLVAAAVALACAGLILLPRLRPMLELLAGSR